jgi:hypothetical protein
MNFVFLGEPLVNIVYLTLSGGKAFSVQLDSIDRIDMHTLLTVRAGDHSSYRMFRHMWPFE